MLLTKVTAPMLAAAAVLMPLLAGCTNNGPIVGGPLGGASSGDSTWICARVGQPVTFSIESFTNNGLSTLVLDRIALRDPHGVHLIGAYVEPGMVQLGVTRGWPPRFPAGIPRRWKHRQPVTGYRLAAGKSFSTVLGMTATATPKGRTPGIAIYYHDSGGSYVANDSLAMIVITRHCPT